MIFCSDLVEKLGMAEISRQTATISATFGESSRMFKILPVDWEVSDEPWLANPH